MHVLDFGQVIASGPPDEIRRNPAVQEAYLGHASGRREPTGGGRVTTAEPGQPGVTHRGRATPAYGRIEVLHGVDLQVPGGSVFALLGPNGAGKSTLLKVINGRLRPTAGIGARSTA